MKINQLGFTEVLAKRAGITFSEADKVVRSFKHLIYESLADGHSVELSGFGQFSVSHREPRLGINPRTWPKSPSANSTLQSSRPAKRSRKQSDRSEEHTSELQS